MFVFFEPYPISVVAKYLRIDNKKLLDFLDTKHGKAFFSTYHPEYEGSRSLEKWVRVNTLNLMKRNANFKPVSVERARSIKRVMETDSFCYYDRKKKRTFWTNDIYNRNRYDFLKYLDRVAHKSLLFVKDPSKPDNFFAPALTLPYSTRFTDKNKQRASREQYFSMWENAALKFDKALMVTFTKDPKLYDNLWDANKDHMKGINNFISFIKKRIKAEIRRYPEFKLMNEALKRGRVMDWNSLNGRRNILIRLLHEQHSRLNPEVTYQEFKSKIEGGSFSHDDLAAIIKEGYKISSHYKDIPDDYELTYINVLEFQLNGRLHSHFAIFGLDYLMDIHELSKKWEDYGQGTIVHAYALKKHPTNPLSWTWKNPNNRPKDHRNKDPIDYLKAYLLKAQYTTSVNYWVFNSRYYTNSRNFEPLEERTQKAILRKQRRLRPRYWIYIKSLNAHTDEFANVRYVDIEDIEEYISLAKSLLNPAGLSASPPTALV